VSAFKLTYSTMFSPPPELHTLEVGKNRMEALGGDQSLQLSVCARGYARYAEQLRTGGAHALAAGEQLRAGDLARGFYVRPIVAEAPLDNPLWEKEMFLPILMVHRVSSNDEAMQLANHSSLGLTVGFYGASDEVNWFHEHIEAVWNS